MDMRKVDARNFTNHTDGVKLANGDWKVTVTIVETINFSDGTVRQETIQYECQDPEFTMAQMEALNAALYELNETVLQKGFTSLIEGRDLQRKLEAENETKADEAERTQ